MPDRSTDDLDRLEPEASAQPAAAVAPPVVKPPEEKPLVDVNYPDPTLLSVVVRDVARWSGQCFVMEPSVNAKIQIFAPRKLTAGDAYELFLASLSVVNLRAVQVGKIVKVVPVTYAVSA